MNAGDTQSEDIAAASEELARLAKALGHPHRIAILRLLRTCNPCICGDIVEQMPIAQSTVSQHLKKLKEAGWVDGEIEGPRTCYCIDKATLSRILTLIRSLLDSPEDSTDLQTGPKPIRIGCCGDRKDKRPADANTP